MLEFNNIQQVLSQQVLEQEVPQQNLSLSPGRDKASNERLLRLNSSKSKEMSFVSVPGSKADTKRKVNTKTIDYIGTNDDSIH